MANIAYIRVSSEDQSEARQIETMKQYNIDRYFTEKKSGKNTDRPQLQEMLRYIREGDVVYIADFSRLARSTLDLLTLVNDFKDRNITLVSIKECVDTSTATGRLMLQMIGAINEFERVNLLERQKEGIAIAKKEGKYKGGKRKEIKNFASEGQQKNAIISYKFAEISMFKDIKGEFPILILDDLFSELDNEKIDNILNLLGEDIQTFITTTDISKVDKRILDCSKKIKVQDGILEEVL